MARIGNSRLQRRICGRVLHDQTCSQHQLSCYTLLSPPHIFKREHDAGSTVQLSRYPLHKLLGYGQIVPEHTLKMCINGSRAHVAVWNSREARITHIGRSRGYSPRGDLRTPPERAGRTTSIEGASLCARVAIIPCVLCYRQPPGFPDGLAVRRVVCRCVIQAIKDKKLNTSNSSPEPNFQISHIRSRL